MTEGQVLVLNAGSATLKATVLEACRRRSRASTERSTGRGRRPRTPCAGRSTRSSRSAAGRRRRASIRQRRGASRGPRRRACSPSRRGSTTTPSQHSRAYRTLAPLPAIRGRSPRSERPAKRCSPRRRMSPSSTRRSTRRCRGRPTLPGARPMGHGPRRPAIWLPRAVGRMVRPFRGGDARSTSEGVTARRRASRRWLLGDGHRGRSLRRYVDGADATRGPDDGDAGRLVDPGSSSGSSARARSWRHRAGARGRVRAARRRRHRRNAPAAGGSKSTTIVPPWRSSCSCVARRLASPPP